MEIIDSTLEDRRSNAHGICEICGDDIGDELLVAHPMTRYCLCDLSSEQLGAIDRDLELAGRIQAGLLPPQSLEVNGWSAYYQYLPAGRVGGDYVDLVSRDADGSLFFLLGDVSGKGVAASLLMAHLSSLFRSLIATGLPAPRIVEQANDIFAASTVSNQYATLVCGHATANGEVDLCVAGHLPPLIVRRRGVMSVDSNGLPLGVFEKSSYSADRVRLERGDSLFLYTDGLTEIRGPHGDEFGVDRVARSLRPRSRMSPSAMSAAVLEDVAAFGNGGTRDDDLTTLVLRRR